MKKVWFCELAWVPWEVRLKTKGGLYRMKKDGRLVIIWHPDSTVHPLTALQNALYAIEHRGQKYFFRCTDDPKEHLKLSELRSRNWRTGRFEKGLSVSEHPYYQQFEGYKYIYVVTGDVVGRGSDGEPVLVNVKPLTKPAPTLPKEWRERYERDVARRSPLTSAEKKWLLKQKNWKEVTLKDLVGERLVPVFYFGSYGLEAPYPPKKKEISFAERNKEKKKIKMPAMKKVIYKLNPYLALAAFESYEKIADPRHARQFSYAVEVFKRLARKAAPVRIEARNAREAIYRCALLITKKTKDPDAKFFASWVAFKLGPAYEHANSKVQAEVDAICESILAQMHLV